MLPGPFLQPMYQCFAFTPTPSPRPPFTVKFRIPGVALRPQTLQIHYVKRRTPFVFLQRTLFQAELNLVATSAAVKMLKVQQENLQEQAAVSKEEQEALFDKYRQIQDFQKLTVSVKLKRYCP